MTFIVWTTVTLLVLATVLGLVRLLTARDEASRAGVGDLVYFSAVSIFVVVGMYSGTSVLFDVASLAALLAIVATVALARILTRGRR